MADRDPTLRPACTHSGAGYGTVTVVRAAHLEWDDDGAARETSSAEVIDGVRIWCAACMAKAKVTVDGQELSGPPWAVRAARLILAARRR